MLTLGEKMNVTRPAIKLLLVLGFSMQFGGAVAFADSSYSVNTTIVSSNPTGTVQNDSIVGTIVTDGATVIGSGDIVSYNLDLIDNLNPANDIDLTSANSTVVEDIGGDLIATASGISFNFANPGEVLFQANIPGPFSGFSYFCFSTGGACLAGETISPGDIFVDGAVLTGAAAPTGVTGLNQNPTTPPPGVPEPSSLALMLAGLVAIGVSSKRLNGRSVIC
jgi:hypothetical protein